MERLIFLSLFYWFNYLVLMATGDLAVSAAVYFYLFLVLIAYPVGNMLFALLNGEKALLDPYFADIVKLLLWLPPICLASIIFGISTKVVLAVAIPSMIFSLVQMARRRDMISVPQNLLSRLNPFHGRMGMVRLGFLVSAILTTAATISMFQLLTEHRGGYIYFNPEVGDTSNYWTIINSMLKHKGTLLDGYNLTNISGMNSRDLHHGSPFLFLTFIAEIGEAQVASLLNIDAVVVHSILWAEFSLLLLGGACFFPATQKDAQKGAWYVAASGMTAFLFFSIPVLIGVAGVSYLVIFSFRSGHITFSTITLIVAIKLFLSFDKAFRLREEVPKIIITSGLFLLATWFHVITGILFFLSWVAALLLHALRGKWDMEIKPDLAVLAVLVFSAIALFALPPLGTNLKLSTFEAVPNYFMMRIELSSGGNVKILPLAAIFLGWGIWHYYGKKIIVMASNRKWGIVVFLALMGMLLAIVSGIYLFTKLHSGGLTISGDSIKTWAYPAQPGSASWYATFIAQEMKNWAKAIVIMVAFSGIWIPLIFIFFKTGNRLHRSYLAILFTSIFLVIWVVPAPGNLMHSGRLGGVYMSRNIFLGSFFMTMTIAPPLFLRMHLGLLTKTFALVLASACAMSFNHFSSLISRENLPIPEKFYSTLRYIKSSTDMEMVVLMDTPFQDYYALVAGYAAKGAVAERAGFYDIYPERVGSVKYFFGHPGFDSRKVEILSKYGVTHILVSCKDRLDLPRTLFVAVYANSDYVLYRYSPQ